MRLNISIIAIFFLVNCGSYKYGINAESTQKSNLTFGVVKSKIIKGTTSQAEILQIFGSPNLTTKNKSNNDYDIIIFTGPIDSYFPGLEKLEYRSIDFDIKVIKNMNYYQPNSVVNYPSIDIPYTRIVEYKHFLNQKSNDTIIVTEKTNDVGEPYYPVPNKKNLELYDKYKKLAVNEESNSTYNIINPHSYSGFNSFDDDDDTLKN
jgi:UDP-galactopyranose mutase